MAIDRATQKWMPNVSIGYTNFPNGAPTGINGDIRNAPMAIPDMTPSNLSIYSDNGKTPYVGTSPYQPVQPTNQTVNIGAAAVPQTGNIDRVGVQGNLASNSQPTTAQNGNTSANYSATLSSLRVSNPLAYSMLYPFIEAKSGENSAMNAIGNFLGANQYGASNTQPTERWIQANPSVGMNVKNGVYDYNNARIPIAPPTKKSGQQRQVVVSGNLTPEQRMQELRNRYSRTSGAGVSGGGTAYGQLGTYIGQMGSKQEMNDVSMTVDNPDHPKFGQDVSGRFGINTATNLYSHGGMAPVEQQVDANGRPITGVYSGGRNTASRPFEQAPKSLRGGVAQEYSRQMTEANKTGTGNVRFFTAPEGWGVATQQSPQTAEQQSILAQMQNLYTQQAAQANQKAYERDNAKSKENSGYLDFFRGMAGQQTNSGRMAAIQVANADAQKQRDFQNQMTKTQVENNPMYGQPKEVQREMVKQAGALKLFAEKQGIKDVSERHLAIASAILMKLRDDKRFKKAFEGRPEEGSPDEKKSAAFSALLGIVKNADGNITPEQAMQALKEFGEQQ